eukprot:5287887-Prymnesium_polylepis.2
MSATGMSDLYFVSGGLLAGAGASAGAEWLASNSRLRSRGLGQARCCEAGFALLGVLGEPAAFATFAQARFTAEIDTSVSLGSSSNTCFAVASGCAAFKRAITFSRSAATSTVMS